MIVNKIFCYIHIPFCEFKCNYCRFASIWNNQNLQIKIYLQNLLKEIKTYASEKVVLASLYFWWGTPSVLSKNQLWEIITTLYKKYIFDKNIEITIESTPNNITKQNIESWYELWINRLSIWVQTLNEKSLEEINRWNKWDIIKALELLKNYSKIKNLNLDFIIWLPYVDKWELLQDIKYILGRFNFIKHISVYMLEDYYNSDKIIENKYDKITYPKKWVNLWIDDNDYLWEYKAIKKYLISKGFNNYEISNFWLKWFECNHNKSYWNHWEVYSFWLWAYFFINWVRYSNPDNFKDYYSWEKIIQSKLSENDFFIENCMFELRTSWLKKHTLNKMDIKKINYFIKNWYLKKVSDKVVLSDTWVLVMDYILGEIIV